MIRIFSVLLMVFFSGFFHAPAPPAELAQKDAERYILECEQQWTDAMTSGKATEVGEFLAMDFVGVDPEGNLYDRAKELHGIRITPRPYVSGKMNEVKVRFYGDAAVAQGSSSWERVAGTPKRGRYVWTDTWVRRNNQWRIVAAEDVTVADPQL